MTKCFLYLAFLIVGLPAVSFSQKGSISGRLMDHETLEPISGIPVVKYGTTVGAISNENGQFFIEKLRNPFNPELFQVRIMVNTKLGDRESVMEDVSKLGNFINGESLQEVISGK